MGLISKRKNKTFSYEPRYYKSDKDGSPYKVQQRFDDYRSTLNTSNSIKGKFSSAWDELRTNPKNSANRRTLYIFVLLGLAVYLYLRF